MKKFNRKLIRGTTWALVGLLSVLGFSGCGRRGMVLEYGTPRPDYEADSITVERTKDDLKDDNENGRQDSTDKEVDVNLKTK